MILKLGLNLFNRDNAAISDNAACSASSSPGSGSHAAHVGAAEALPAMVLQSKIANAQSKQVHFSLVLSLF